MPAIGNITCEFVKGEAPLPKQRVVLWQVPGIDGYGAQLMGLGDAEFRFVAVQYGLPNAVAAWARSIQNLQGSVVTIINDWGRSFPRCLIVHVGPLVDGPAHFQGGCRGEIEIHGVVTGR